MEDTITLLQLLFNKLRIIFIFYFNVIINVIINIIINVNINAIINVSLEICKVQSKSHQVIAKRSHQCSRKQLPRRNGETFDRGCFLF